MVSTGRWSVGGCLRVSKNAFNFDFCKLVEFYFFFSKSFFRLAMAIIPSRKWFELSKVECFD